VAKIVVICGTSGPAYPWGDAFCEKGLGGSEEYLVYITRALAALGHEVVVSNNCGEEFVGTHNGVTYVPFTEPLPEGDVLISQRNWTLLMNQPNYKMRLLSCHDCPVPEALHGPAAHQLDWALQNIDYFLLLNNYHRQAWNYIPSNHVCLTGVGIDHSMFENRNIVRDPGRCVYFSHPGKGLQKLRNLWPRIREAVPTATLHAFWNDPQFWHHPIEDIGIMPMKWLGPQEIADETLRASLFTYPSVHRENLPMVCMKAQRGGAVPVVICAGGMDETIQWGYKCHDGNFVENVIAMLRQPAQQQIIREPMMEWAKQFTWEAAAQRIAALWEARGI